MAQEQQQYDTSRHDEWGKPVVVALKAAVNSGLVGTEEHPVAEFISFQSLQAQLSRCTDAFAGPARRCSVLHAYAIKANPMRKVLQIISQAEGFGAECASIEEITHALDVGFPPSKIVYDSPAKTSVDLQTAIEKGCYVNLDNLEEVQAVEDLARLHGWSIPRGQIGVRINPVVGAGSIGETSTATLTSKFGLNLTAETAPQLLQLFHDHPWLSGVHCHVGSQGCTMDMLVEGAAVIVKFALQVNEMNCGQITIVDIGGGLSANYSSNDPFMPGMDYCTLVGRLEKDVPELFNGQFKVLTEFGRSIVSKCGFAASSVSAVKHNGGEMTAVIYAGANMFVREAYNPTKWFHRITVHDSTGAVKTSAHLLQPRPGEAPPPPSSSSSSSSSSSPADLIPTNIAGPLCFSGDYLAKQLPLPTIEKGDLVVIHDTGGYTHSMYSYYNSRTPPPVYGYTINDVGDIAFVIIKKQTMAETLGFWG